MLQLFWPTWPSAGGYRTRQHMGNFTPTLCVWDPECSSLPSRCQDAAEVIVTFSSVFKSLCSIIILTRAVGSKAMTKKGREALLTLLVCIFLLGFYPHFFLNLYRTGFLPPSSKPHSFGEKSLVLLLSDTDFGS